jgi:hypothetical protein
VKLTLCEDEVVLLNKGLERVLVELLDVGSGNGSRKESSADGCVLHGEVWNVWCGGCKRLWVRVLCACRRSAVELAGGLFITSRLVAWNLFENTVFTF